ncbi:MAG: hypothetical protein HY778_15905 [Betaproteobacteria bacterium]|nr:hypothetical protein [Betaproteobacteria bacterium]
MKRQSAFPRVAWAACACALLTLGCSSADKEAPSIAFASHGEGYAAKPDFAQMEYLHPLSVEDLYKITPKNIALLEQEQVDQIYARLSAGPIPDGPFEGDLFFPRGGSGKLRLSEIAGGGLRGLLVNVAGKKLDLIGETLWKGKVFYRDQRLLRNRIEDLSALKGVGLVQEDPDNPLQKIAVRGRDQWLLFPARLYCGQSLLDGRRESIIIDYAFTDQLPGYHAMPDRMAGRDGFAIRDEIRMVRPGFYLGRAYIDRSFVVNFVLYNEQVAEGAKAEFMKAGRVQEDCWVGTQRRMVMAQAG